MKYLGVFHDTNNRGKQRKSPAKAKAKKLKKEAMEVLASIAF